MNRRGFALLAVLWLVTALSALIAGGLLSARLGLKASGNRVILARAEWAREACVELMLARGFSPARSGSISVTRTAGRVDLGRQTWCELRVIDPSRALNLNLATEASLRKVLQSDSLADALLDWRDKDDSPRPRGAETVWYRQMRRRSPRNGPLASVKELSLVRGFENLDQGAIESLFTVRGRGIINVNGAPPAVLQAVAGLPEELVHLVRARNARGEPVENLDHLIGLAPPSHRPALASRYQDLVQLLAFSSTELVVVAAGGVGESPLRSTGTLTVVPIGDRIAVIRREVE